MSKYPLIEKLGLDHWDEGGSIGYVIKAEDLEDILKCAPKVYGHYRGILETNTFQDNKETVYAKDATHTARLLLLEETSKEVTKKEIEFALKIERQRGNDVAADLYQRILEHGYAPQNGGKDNG